MLKSNSLFAAVQAIVNSLSLFAMYHLVSRHVGIEILGFWSVAAAVASLAGVVDCGVPDATVRQVAERRASGGEGWVRVVATAVLFVAGVLAIAGILAWPAVAWVVRYLFVEIGSEASRWFAVGALVVGWLNACGTTVQGVVEGLERYDVRAGASILAGLLAVTVTVVFVPRIGAAGFVAALVVQALVNLAAQGIFIRRQTRAARDRTPSLADLRQLIAVGLPLRLASLSNFASEPLTRVLVARFGGAEFAGIFEAAWRLVGQVRAMIVAASQPMVPRLTALGTTGSGEFGRYLQAFTSIVRIVSTISMTSIVLLLPAMSFAMVSRVDRNFILVGSIMALAWFMNLRSAPAYFANLAQRRLAWNWGSQVVFAALNLLLGVSLGLAFGAIGVAVGTAISLGAANQLVIWSRRSLGDVRTAVSPGDRAFVFGSGLLAAGFVTIVLTHDQSGRLIIWSLLAAAAYGVITVLSQSRRIASLRSVRPRSNV